MISANRTTMRRNEDRDAALRFRLKELVKEKRDLNARDLHILLRQEGLVQNHKRTERVYREENLSLHLRRRKCKKVFRRIPKKPFLKWAGGKFRLVGKILNELPKGKRFIEPFAGSATIYLNITMPEAVICDINSDLISLYTILQQEGKTFIDYAQQFFIEKNNEEERYYELRENFNESSEPYLKAALFLYLNRHCFNGLVRYNVHGKFNVPFGSYSNPYFPLNEMLNFFKKTKKVKTLFAVKDFRQVFENLQSGDVVYCDPPYMPLSHTASFTEYAGKVFTESNQKELSALALQAWERGIPVILSNHDTEYMRTLYSGARIKRFNVQRFISSKAFGRTKAPEMLAIYK